MTDPRIIALSSNPGQVEPGPFSEHDLREQWNAQADELNQWESLDSCEQLAWAQTRAIAADRFLPPVAKPTPVDLAVLHDPDFSDGLTPSQHLDVLWGGPDPRVTATPAPEEPEAGRVLRLAEIIREADPADRIGGWAHQLAQALLKHPGFSGCHNSPADLPAPDHVNLIGFAFGREPWATWLRQGGCLESAHCELSDLMLAVLAKWGRLAALPAQGEVEDLVEFVDELASARILTATYAAQLRHIAAILKGIPALPAPGFQIGPQEYIPDFTSAPEAQGVAVDRYEFSVVDSDDCEQAGGSAPTLDDAIREGRNYLRQYNQDGSHKLELRRVHCFLFSEATDGHA